MNPKPTVTVLSAVFVTFALASIPVPAQQRSVPDQQTTTSTQTQTRLPDQSTRIPDTDRRRRGRRPSSPATPPVTPVTPVIPVAPTIPVASGYLQASNIENLGAFKFPMIPGDAVVPGGPVVYNPARNTLLVVTNSQRVIEISVPTPVNSNALPQLPTATLIAGPVDVLKGKRELVDGDPANGAPIYGLFIDGTGRLIVSVTRYYDGWGTQQRSHFITGTDLNNLPDVKGPFQVGSTFSSAAGFAGGWMAAIPPTWRQYFNNAPAFTGQCCVSILYRTSSGPSISEFDPVQLGVLDPVPARPRIAYPLSQPTIGTYDSQWGDPGVFYHMTTDIVGLAPIERYRTIAFAGRTGTGPNCYGPGPVCGDPDDSAQGPHAAPYENGLWLYKLDDVVAAKHYSEPVPYAYVKLNLVRNGGQNRLAGAWFDPLTERLFILSRDGDTNGSDKWYGLVHVLQIK